MLDTSKQAHTIGLANSLFTGSQGGGTYVEVCRNCLPVTSPAFTRISSTKYTSDSRLTNHSPTSEPCSPQQLLIDSQFFETQNCLLKEY